MIPTPRTKRQYGRSTRSSKSSKFQGMVSSEVVRQHLTELEWPKGLQSRLLERIEENPLRYFIIDDSAQMLVADSPFMNRESKST